MKFLTRLFKVFAVIFLSGFFLIAFVVVGIYSCFYWLFTGKNGVEFYTNCFIKLQSKFIR